LPLPPLPPPHAAIKIAATHKIFFMGSLGSMSVSAPSFAKVTVAAHAPPIIICTAAARRRVHGRPAARRFARVAAILAERYQLARITHWFV
jgi:hypothetical protein